MKLKRHSRFHHEVSTSALNDIMFFLLLFFLIVATVANPQVIKLMLPKASEADEVHPKQPVTLTVDADTSYYVGAEKVPFDQLEGKILQETKEASDPTIILRVARELDVQTLVNVMELGMRLEMKMVLQTSLN
jgi:biopolymer transport protein ExbD